MRPIPKRLLIHSATLKTPNGVDAWQNTTYQDQAISHVRVEPCSKIVQTKDNTEVQLTSLLIYDCRNSSPAGITFEVQQKIKWNGTEYTIVSPEPLYDESKLHHWEVGLA